MTNITFGRNVRKASLATSAVTISPSWAGVRLVHSVITKMRSSPAAASRESMTRAPASSRKGTGAFMVVAQ